MDILNQQEITIAHKSLKRELKIRAERSLKNFVIQAWPIIEPTTPLIDNWHIDLICEHLEAVSRGEIKRLLINVPPGSMKSILINVCWFCWDWIKRPSLRWLCTSHSSELVIRDSLKCRRLITSPWYRGNWRYNFILTSDQNVKGRFENNKTGYRIALPLGAGITGEKADRILFDDPHDAKDCYSNTKIENTCRDWDECIEASRLNDDKTGAIVGIMQRLSENDLSGRKLSQGGWEHLCIPMEYEGENRIRTSLGKKDPRTKTGELFWPQKFDEKVLAPKRTLLGNYGIAGQWQQRPAPLTGGIININLFKRYKILPNKTDWKQILQGWDTASKANELTNCPWVCGTWIITDTGYYLADVYRQWMTYPDGKRAVKSLADKWNPHVIIIEDKSTGQSLLQELPLERAFPFYKFEPEKDKVTRLATESPAIDAGMVYLPESAVWLADYELEMQSFPNSATMDQCDMTSMILKYIREKSFPAIDISSDKEEVRRKKMVIDQNRYRYGDYERESVTGRRW